MNGKRLSNLHERVFQIISSDTFFHDNNDKKNIFLLIEVLRLAKENFYGKGVDITGRISTFMITMYLPTPGF